MRKIILILLTVAFFGNMASQTYYSIPQIQGTGSKSNYIDQTIKTSGIITAKFVGENSVNAFFLQDAVGDGNPASSDGIFVYTVNDDINIGDKIEIVATVVEYYEKTQLTNIISKRVLSTNNSLPVIKLKYTDTEINWEQYEGMLVEFDQELYVSSNTDLEQYGQISLLPFRKLSPTNQVLPGSNDYYALQNKNTLSPIIVDDAINTSYYKPIILINEEVTRRIGEKTKGLRGVVDYNFSRFLIYPTENPIFYGNPRPTKIENLGDYDLKVCSFNLEYYLTANYGGGFGADSEADAARQHSKIIAALLTIDADIYGLNEIEQGQAALAKLTNALNEIAGSNKYDYINDGGTSFGTYTKAGFIYRKDKVSPHLNLTNNNSPTPINRKKIQAFIQNSDQERFILSINHFKAKSGCSSASGDNIDIGDGQSCFNATRLAEANSTIQVLNSLKSYYNDDDVLIVGDLNAYAMEDPIRAFIDNGYLDLHRRFHADSSYSYVYRGEAGYLDHALANQSMSKQITGMSSFHINADEPSMFEYGASNYYADMYRCSDHDPVVIGIKLNKSSSTNDTTLSELEISSSIFDKSLIVYEAQGGQIHIYDMNGWLCHYSLSNSNTHEMNLTKLSTGLYILKVYVDNKIKRRIVIKK
jgi:predicted extracellular nuclease